MENISENIKKHFKILKGQEQYFMNDIRIIEFFAQHPLNNNKADVRNKISAINHKDITRMIAGEAMIDHILKLDIDKKLNANDLSVVEEIAAITLNGKKHNLLNFASVYCNYHKPEVYPIYSDQHLELAKSYIKKNNLKINPDDLNKYLVMKEVLDDIIKRHLSDSDINYLEVRKFGWIHLDKVLSESMSTTTH